MTKSENGKMKIDDFWEKLGEEEDVAQKRYLMFHIFEELLDTRLSLEDIEREIPEKINQLKQIDGYMYKLSQDFLTSSSTMKKENKLEKIIQHIERKKE
jgi:ATP phosphoribosyltransferase